MRDSPRLPFAGRPPRRLVPAICALALGLLGIACQPLERGRSSAETASQSAGGAGEVRGVWVSGIEQRYSPEAYAALLKRGNVNVVYLSVYNDGKPNWDSPAYARAMGLPHNVPADPNGNDLPQKRLVEVLKEHGIAVVAWVESGFSLGSESDAFAARNPTWLQKDSAGQTRGEEHPEYGGLRFLSPAHPEAMAYFAEAMAELAHPRYGFDGIQLERIRYTRGKNDRYMGYEEATKSRMQGGGYERTRRVHATNALRQVVGKIRAINPGLMVSLGADGAYAVERFDQPWNYWLKEGIVDHVEVQAYGKTQNEFLAHYVKVQALAGDVKSKVTIGYRAMDRNDAVAVEAQVRYARERGWKNVALFGDSSHSYYAEDNVKAHAAPGHVWASPAPHPFLKKAAAAAPAPAWTPESPTYGGPGNTGNSGDAGDPGNAPGTSVPGASYATGLPAAGVTELVPAFSQGTTSLKARPLPDNKEQSNVICVVRPGDALRVRSSGLAAGSLGTKAFMSVELAEPLPGCADARNRAGARVHVWAEHFRKR